MIQTEDVQDNTPAMKRLSVDPVIPPIIQPIIHTINQQNDDNKENRPNVLNVMLNAAVDASEKKKKQKVG